MNTACSLELKSRSYFSNRGVSHYIKQMVFTKCDTGGEVKNDALSELEFVGSQAGLSGQTTERIIKQDWIGQAHKLAKYP